jgi:hypothetical protein
MCLDSYVGVILQMQVMYVTYLQVSLLLTLLLLLAVVVVSYFYVVWVGTAYMYTVYQWRTKWGIGGFKLHQNSEVLTKLSRIPSSMENTSVKT